MNFEQYSDYVGLYNGILKNTPVNAAVYRTHYDLICLKIKNIEVFIACFQKHVSDSDWFPTHVDLFKYLPEIEKEIKKEAEKNDPILREYKKLKALEIEQSDEFMSIRDKNLFDEYREKLFDTQKRIADMLSKYPILNDLKN